jgi:hypothetical protein
MTKFGRGFFLSQKTDPNEFGVCGRIINMRDSDSRFSHVVKICVGNLLALLPAMEPGQTR